MTPEERARNVVLPWYRGPYDLHVDTSYQEVEIADIAAAIRAAVEAEREACALAADSIANDHWDMFKGRGKHAPNNPMRADPYADGVSRGAEECAAVIRNRGNT